MSADEGYILTCRDGADALRGLEETLTEAGYSVRSFEDGQSVVRHVTAQVPDLVLIDETVRDLTPLQVVKQLGHRPGARYVPLIILSSQGRGDDAASAINAGASDYIRKPYDLGEVLARIGAHVERGRVTRAAKKEADTRAIVLDVVRDVTASLSSEEIFHILVRRVSRLFQIRRCSMILVNDTGDRGTVVAAHDDPSISALSIDLGRYPEIRQATETKKTPKHKQHIEKLGSPVLHCIFPNIQILSAK